MWEFRRGDLSHAGTSKGQKSDSPATLSHLPALSSSTVFSSSNTLHTSLFMPVTEQTSGSASCVLGRSPSTLGCPPPCPTRISRAAHVPSLKFLPAFVLDLCPSLTRRRSCCGADTYPRLWSLFLRKHHYRPLKSYTWAAHTHELLIQISPYRLAVIISKHGGLILCAVSTSPPS